PLFHTTAEFNQAYLSDEVLRRSIFLRPSAIGPLPDGNNHHVAFQTRKSWWFLSDPRRGDVTLDDEAFDGDVRHAINDRGATALTPVALQELLGKMAQIVDERSRERRRVNRSSLDLPAFDLSNTLWVGDPLLHVAYVARTFFAAECLVAFVT